jgi:hypothetical protein
MAVPMNRFDKFALIASILMTLLGASGVIATTELYFRFQHPSWTMKVVAGIGWVIWTYGPILVTALFWRWSKRVRFAWTLHLLLLPCIWAVMVAGSRLMLFAMNLRDFDDTLGGPIMMGLFLTLVGIAGYIVVVLFSWTIWWDEQRRQLTHNPMRSLT